MSKRAIRIIMKNLKVIESLNSALETNHEEFCKYLDKYYPGVNVTELKEFSKVTFESGGEYRDMLEKEFVALIEALIPKKLLWPAATLSGLKAVTALGTLKLSYMTMVIPIIISKLNAKLYELIDEKLIKNGVEPKLTQADIEKVMGGMGLGNNSRGLMVQIPKGVDPQEYMEMVVGKVKEQLPEGTVAEPMSSEGLIPKDKNGDPIIQ